MPSPVNVRETRESCLRQLVLLSISTNATSPLRTGAILCLSLTASHSFKPYRFSPTPWEPLPKGTRGRLPGPDGGLRAPAVGESRVRRPWRETEAIPERSSGGPLRPVNSENAHPIRITATAGTNLVRVIFSPLDHHSATRKKRRLRPERGEGSEGGARLQPRPTPPAPSPAGSRLLIYDPKAFIVYHSIATLGQACAHCPKFLTAAQKRRVLFHSRCGGTFSQTRQGSMIEWAITPPTVQSQGGSARGVENFCELCPWSGHTRNGGRRTFQGRANHRGCPGAHWSGHHPVSVFESRTPGSKIPQSSPVRRRQRRGAAPAQLACVKALPARYSVVRIKQSGFT